MTVLGDNRSSIRGIVVCTVKKPAECGEQGANLQVVNGYNDWKESYTICTAPKKTCPYAEMKKLEGQNV